MIPQRQRISYSIAVALGVMLLWHPVPGAAQGIDHERQYKACIALTYRDAWAAYESARQWESHGGGAPARHCAAMALLEAGEPARAAEQLEGLAAVLPPEYSPSPVALLAQAANIWLLAGDNERARQAIDAALQGEPDAAPLLIDRARILAELKDYAGALADLDRAIELAPQDADAQAFRAAALRHLGDAAAAMQAAETALRLDPDNPSARLERGLARRETGDRDGARADWAQVALEHAGTPAAEAARSYLEQLDVRVK
jgi:tetratricopeptide (TPR) repeat protein